MVNMEYIYLDNSATTKPSEKAVQKAVEMMTSNYGNPSSLHTMGLNAELEIENARETVADSLSVKSSDIFFTSGGTEANNTVLLGAAHKQRRSGKRIITTKIEHSSVIDAAKELEKRGYEVIYLDCDSNGCISPQQLKNAVNDETVLVSVMTVNNEIGSVQNIADLVKAVKEKNRSTLFHTDAVQAYGKIKLLPEKWNVDFMSVSAHKVHAPKNVGALYIKNRNRIYPLMFGGEQQKKIRPGTEISSLIPAFGAAVSEFNIQKNYEYIKSLNSYARKKLSDIESIYINSSAESLPYILNISIPGIKSEIMLHFLESKNIFVSSGSACAKGKKSYVLTALGLDNSRIDSAVRISFSKYNTEHEIDRFISSLLEGIERLAKKR